jgi:hypothetical protein
MNAIRSQSLWRLQAQPQLMRYLSLMFLMMTRGSTGDGMEMHADTNGDIVNGVWVTKDRKRMEEWVRPDYCTSRAVNVLREQLSFGRGTDNAEQATWTIAFGHREVNVRIHFIPEEMGTTIRLELDNRLDPGDAEQVLNEWFPDEAIESGAVTSFLRDEPSS